MASSGDHFFCILVEPVSSSAKKAFKRQTRPCSQAQIQFDQGTFIKGLTFGSNTAKCHIQLGQLEEGFSNNHFAINLNDEGEFELVDTSKLGTTLRYSKQEFQILEDRAILPDNDPIIIEVQNFTCKIRLSSVNRTQRSTYLEARKSAPPAIESLDFHTLQHTEVAPSRAVSLLRCDKGHKNQLGSDIRWEKIYKSETVGE
jgi:hypothetical protein